MIIRINLLPGYKRKTKTDPLKTAQTVLALLLLLAVAICAFLAISISSKHDELQAENRKLNAQKTQLDTELAALPKLQSTIEDLKAREKLLEKLTNLRIGPQHILDEFSKILTYPQNAVQLKHAQENSWTLSWDVENIYLTKIQDLGDGQILIEGVAKTMEDISELWLRLKSSPLMRNVRLNEIRENKSGDATTILQQFSFNAEANFYYQTRESIKNTTKQDSDAAIMKVEG